MSASDAVVPFTASSDEHEPELGGEWDWQSCHPDEGEAKFVAALQKLGIDLAKAVPVSIQEEAIYKREPTSDLLRGKFTKTPTKERLLNLSVILS